VSTPESGESGDGAGSVLIAEPARTTPSSSTTPPASPPPQDRTVVARLPDGLTTGVREHQATTPSLVASPCRGGRRILDHGKETSCRPGQHVSDAQWSAAYRLRQHPPAAAAATALRPSSQVTT
jgi:hypothetical protein